MLSGSDKKALAVDLRANVQKTLSGLRPFAQSRWLSSNNRYSSNASAVLKKETNDKNSAPAKSPPQLAQYVAASCLLHCSDGWGYLGKALHAFLRGDPHRTRHLAYYAELRAALAILATEGIGVFNGQHVFVDAPDRVTRVFKDGGTHDFVWHCIEYWSTLSRSGDLFASIVSPHQRTLQEWMFSIGGASAIHPTAGAWFREWGMDLSFARLDRTARNESSYLPDGLPQSWYIDVRDALDISRDIWSALALDGQTSFAGVDQHILRVSLEMVFTGVNGKTAAQAPAAFEGFVTKVITDQNFSDGVGASWRRFLLREDEPQDLSLLTYSKQLPTQLGSAQSVLARASLLLRMASGAVAQLLHASNVSGKDISFWWTDLGARRGLWRGSKTLDELADLGADISAHLEDITEYQRSTASNDQDFHDVGDRMAKAIVALGSCERIGIASMTPTPIT